MLSGGGGGKGAHKHVCKAWPGAQMFPLPSQPARAAILGIHTRRWHQPPRPDLLAELAQRCVGFCGADLKAPSQAPQLVYGCQSLSRGSA